MTRITATIVAFNEERNLPRAIESLQCVDEIVVVDSGSSDRTRELALSLGARVIEESWRGYAAQKNFAAECASNQWVLSLDADEALGEELIAEIAAWKNSAENSVFAGFSAPRLTQYIGRWILHSGWYPDRKIRCYDRSLGRWSGDYVHESVQVNGPVGEFQGNILHFTCDSVGNHLRTLDRYTSLAAEELRAKRTIISARQLVIGPIWTFFRTYILQRGFEDGLQGLTIAWTASLYVFLKYAKARGLE